MWHWEALWKATGSSTVLYQKGAPPWLNSLLGSKVYPVGQSSANAILPPDASCGDLTAGLQSAPHPHGLFSGSKDVTRSEVYFVA